MSATYVIRGNLSEGQIEADVAEYLGWCAAGMPFRLHHVDEQLTGADKLCDVTVPIYIQFKKSTGLHSIASRPIQRRRVDESALQEIRRFRAQHDLPDDPTLFFELRKRAKNAPDLQHNILLEHNRPPFSHAIYVAPLYLDRDKYWKDIFEGDRFRDDPWMWHESQIRHGWWLNSWISRFGRQPFLKGHISIAPHQRVEDHEHYYAYSQAGDSISWHSPEVLERGASRLSDFMSVRVRQLLTSGYELRSPEQCFDAARKIMETLDIVFDGVRGDGGPIEQLHQYGQWLWKEHQIRQVLVLGKRKILDEIRQMER